MCQLGFEPALCCLSLKRIHNHCSCFNKTKLFELNWIFCPLLQLCLSLSIYSTLSNTWKKRLKGNLISIRIYFLPFRFVICWNFLENHNFLQFYWKKRFSKTMKCSTLFIDFKLIGKRKSRMGLFLCPLVLMGIPFLSSFLIYSILYAVPVSRECFCFLISTWMESIFPKVGRTFP